MGGQLSSIKMQISGGVSAEREGGSHTRMHISGENDGKGKGTHLQAGMCEKEEGG